jgi:aspartyl-tRNA(Asn)/glutamyl-tRNA(Gln) amidotransferase subunit B
MKLTPIIGLEVHVELKTASKMFCGCSANYFGHPPNSHCCPVCLGLPGALPVPNQKAIEWTIILGLSLNCKIPSFSKFDRKNYFYPDLPKGYQISQYDFPFCQKGFIEIESKRIDITRVHLEEDTGKLIHVTINGKKSTLIDFNRSGVPLVEIVTEPNSNSSEEVDDYLKKLQQIIRYLNISDADMEKGSMRCEPNISLKKAGERGLPSYKVEIKNINSFRFVKKAIDYEILRQKRLIENGEIPEQETRGFDEKKMITLPQRGKEEAHDYRYFPEPDIPPFRWRKEYLIKLKKLIPELPDQKLVRFIKDYQLSRYNAEILTRTKKRADYFDQVVKDIKTRKELIKTAADVIINKKVNINKILPAHLVKILLTPPKKSKILESEVIQIIKRVLNKNPKAVADFKNGKNQAIGYLIGQVINENKDIDPKTAKEVIIKILKKLNSRL